MSEPYVDQEFYDDEYEGQTVVEADFPRFSKRASDIVDSLTEYQIRKTGMDIYRDEVQELIKKATCAQIEYYALQGIHLDTLGVTSSGLDARIGDFSYSSNSSQEGRQSSRVAPNTLMYLEGTGLLRKRSVRVGVI